MKVWIGSLAAYSAGCLHGDWLDFEEFSDLEEMESVIQSRIMATCPEKGEEWGVFDTEDVPQFLSIGDYPALAPMWEFWDVLNELEEYERENFAAWFDELGCPDPDVQRFRDSFAGEAGSVAEFAEDLAEETGLLESVPENLRCYFDWEKYGRDMEFNGDILKVDVQGGWLFFWGNA